MDTHNREAEVEVISRPPRQLTLDNTHLDASKMATSDKVLGSAMLLVAFVVFTYYTTWALLLPFLSPTSFLHDLFPPREWAVRGPALLLLIGLAGVGAFFAKVSAAEAAKKRRQSGKSA